MISLGNTLKFLCFPCVFNRGRIKFQSSQLLNLKILRRICSPLNTDSDFKQQVKSDLSCDPHETSLGAHLCLFVTERVCQVEQNGG